MNGMNGFKRLVLENFQSHCRTEVQVAPAGNLTVIVGPSDSGKTAVIRGLRWLLFNTPNGDDFIRVGSTLCRVTLELESGHQVIRERTKGGTNRYKVLVPGQDIPDVYEGFGTDVPLEIRQLTGVQPVQIGDIELNLNIAEQLDGPFLGKGISAGARAKVLGKLAGTEEIDFAGKELGTDLYRRNQDVKRLGSELAGLDERIEEYGWLDEYKRRISELEQLAARVRSAQERRGKVAGLKERYATAQDGWLECQGILQHWDCLPYVEREVSKVAAFMALKQDYAHKRGRVAALEDSIMDCCDVFERWQVVEVAEIATTNTQRLAERRNQLIRHRDILDITNTAVENAQQTLARLSGLGEADTIAGSVQSLTERRRALCSLNKALTGGMAMVDEAEKALRRWAGVDEAEQSGKSALLLIARREEAESYLDDMKHFSSLAQSAREQAVLWETRLAELEGAYRDELASLGICPLCQSVISPDKLKEVC